MIIPELPSLSAFTASNHRFVCSKLQELPAFKNLDLPQINYQDILIQHCFKITNYVVEAAETLFYEVYEKIASEAKVELMNKETKFETNKILAFQLLKQISCRLITLTGETASGFLTRTEDGLVAISCFASLLRTTREITRRSLPRCVIIELDNCAILAKLETDLLFGYSYNLIKFKISSGCEYSLFTTIKIAPNAPLVEGTDIYFSGYTSGKLMLHKGYISSMSENTVSTFAFDGKIAPGHAGGPVAIVYKNIFCLIGIIIRDPDVDLVRTNLQLHNNLANFGIGLAVRAKHINSESIYADLDEAKKSEFFSNVPIDLKTREFDNKGFKAWYIHNKSGVVSKILNRPNEDLPLHLEEQISLYKYYIENIEKI